MKKIFLAFGLLSFVAFGCNNASKDAVEETQEVITEAKYACPMECEGDKTYSEAGKCPTCKMDLVLADNDLDGHSKEADGDHEGHDHDENNH